MSSNPTAGRRTTLSLAGLIAVASATLVLAVSGAHEGHADTGHGHADAVAVSATTTAKQAKFQDAWTFALTDADGRQAHLSGQVAAALTENAADHFRLIKPKAGGA
jgi:hypothetical protein